MKVRTPAAWSASVLDPWEALLYPEMWRLMVLIRRFEPETGNTERYDDMFPRYQDMVRCLSSDRAAT